MTSALIETHYLPSIGYFSALQRFETIIIERHENFIKQTYRNRCRINTAHGTEVLIIPLTSKHGKVPITDVRIDYSQKWLNNHWRSIQSAYGKAPFFEYYAEDLHHILYKKYDFLYDLNHHFLSICLKWLKWSIDVKESTSFAKVAQEGVSDLRNTINAKNYEASNIYYKAAPYNQVFGNKFVNDLSLIDLIFCTGPQSSQIVQLSRADE